MRVLVLMRSILFWLSNGPDLQQRTHRIGSPPMLDFQLIGLILVANYPTILPLVRKEADKSLRLCIFLVLETSSLLFLECIA